MSKEKLLLVGAGGFGRMVAEQAMIEYDCAFLYRSNQSNYYQSYLRVIITFLDL